MSEQKIRITLEDLAHVAEEKVAPATSSLASNPGNGPRKFGNIGGATPLATSADAPGNLLLQGWFYLGLAGLTGAFTAWAICEPYFDDAGGQRWGNIWIFPMMLTLMCLGFGVAESIVERTPRKAATRAALSLLLGVVLGFIFFGLANVLYNVGLNLLFQNGIRNPQSPGLWVVRSIAWAVFGVAGGIVYGIVGQSKKKCLYGILGGMVGAGLGGLLFNPIALALGGAEVSRAVGISLFGAATGVAMGFVESALKDRWLFVNAGPLAGKQFILYKSVTAVGSDQGNDIYLFKDPAVLPQHAWIEIRANQASLRPAGPTFVNGQPARNQLLHSGDVVQIGRYTFRYQEKQRT